MVLNDWKSVVLRETSTIEEAILNIDKSGAKAAVIADASMKLLGIVTDGDIRRAIIKKIPLSEPVTKIFNTNPIAAKEKTTRSERIQIMKKHEIICLPVINESRELIGLDFISDLLNANKFDNPVFLMAGGFGKRLGPLTEECPKPLLKIGGKPILESILEMFIGYGFREFYISVHYLPEKIMEYFGNGDRWGVNINYVHEDKPLGTGGALGLLPSHLKDLPLIMMNGDILANIDIPGLLASHIRSGSKATMCVRGFDFQVPYGVVKTTDNLVNQIEEKPIHKFFVNAGVYVIDPSVYRTVKKDQVIDMPTLINERISAGEKVSVYQLNEYWLDIGQKNDFERAQLDFHDIFSKLKDQ